MANYTGIFRLLHSLGVPPVRAPRPAEIALPAYVALGYWAPSPVGLNPRLELLIARLAAELSGCQWCIAESRHRWLKAFLPPDLLSHVRAHATSSAFTERERAALGLVEAAARHSERDAAAANQALARARRHFTESELARLAAAAAGEHFFDPATGAVGLDAVIRASSPERTTPWQSIDKGVAIRGLY